MNSKLPGEVIQRVKAVAGVETLLVLAGRGVCKSEWQNPATGSEDAA